MVTLRPMTESEFGAYLGQAVKTYADEKVKAGNWRPEEALERSKQDFRTLLSEGVKTKSHHLFSIQDTASDQTVGMIWFGVAEQVGQASAFIYDFSVDEAWQGRGYGKAALLGLEAKVKALGLNAISLHVFGHNRVARALYEKLGYEVTNVNMTKQLSS